MKADDEGGEKDKSEEPVKNVSIDMDDDVVNEKGKTERSGICEVRAKVQAILLEAANKFFQFYYMLKVPVYDIFVLDMLTFCLVFPFILWAVEANLNGNSCGE